ncbi:MAG: outer membrane protein assembly factor BamD, partial [Thiohalocapsa sp.]
YMKRGAYLAAANRAQYVIERFQRTSAVDDALEVLIEAYDRLGKNDLAADARRVLELNRREGRFIDDTVPPEEVSLGRRIWDYLGLDEN